MADKTAVADWSLVPNDNDNISGIALGEGMAPSGVNNALRTIMAQLKASLTPATQAQMEAATDLIAPVTPGRQKFHPSAAKGWGVWSNSGVIQASYNIGSITDVNVGVHIVNWTVPFSTPAYSVAANALFNPNGSAAGSRVMHVASLLTGSTSLTCVNASTWLATDPTFWMASAFGDQ